MSDKVKPSIFTRGLTSNFMKSVGVGMFTILSGFCAATAAAIYGGPIYVLPATLLALGASDWATRGSFGVPAKGHNRLGYAVGGVPAFALGAFGFVQMVTEASVLAAQTLNGPV